MTEADGKIFAYLRRVDNNDVCSETLTELLLASWRSFSATVENCEVKGVDFPNLSPWPADPSALKDGTPRPCKSGFEIDRTVNPN